MLFIRFKAALRTFAPWVLCLIAMVTLATTLLRNDRPKPNEPFVILNTAASVRSLSFLSADEELVTGHDDGSVLIWNAATGDLKRQLQEADGGIIRCLKCSPDGRILAAGHSSGRILLWDMRTREAIGALEGHSSAVISLAFHPRDQLLASAAGDWTIRIWSLERAIVMSSTRRKRR